MAARFTGRPPRPGGGPPRPEVVAVLGVGAYRTAFARPRAAVGPQPEQIGGARGWLLPNPSGLNAHYQLPDLATAFAALGRWLG